MGKRVKTAKGVHANEGVIDSYRRALQKLIARMSKRVEKAVLAEYKKRPPKVAKLAQDTAKGMNEVLDDLAKEWSDTFAQQAEELAPLAMKKAFMLSQQSLVSALKKAGWTVEFKMSPAMKDALNAKIQENIDLIKSIPEQYLEKVRNAVWDGYSLGGDLEKLTRDLKHIYPITDARAEFIARDQCRKANAVTNKTRMQELGLKKGVWKHSHGGKHPRKSHEAADGREFDLDKGCLIDGKYIFPGEEPNCRCIFMAVLDNVDVEA